MYGRRATIILAGLAAILISACSASASSGPTAAPTAAPTVAGTPHNNAVPQSLQGDYKGTIANSTVSPGEWPMVVMPTDIMVTNPHPGAEAFYLDMVDITADRITFKGSAECTPGAPHKEGVYTYALVNNELKFTAVDDLCADRRTMLTATAWLRQP